MTTLREQILQAVDIASTTLVIPEWGDAKLVLRGLSARDRYALVSRFSGEDGQIAYEDLYPALIIACAHDEDGDVVFTADDKDLIAGKNSVVVERIATACMKISGMSSDKTDSKGDPVTPSDDEGKAS